MATERWSNNTSGYQARKAASLSYNLAGNGKLGMGKMSLYLWKSVPRCKEMVAM